MLGVVSLLIAFVYTSFYVVVVIPWNWFYTTFGWVNILCFNIVVGNLVLNYYRAIFSDPGFAPLDWVCSFATPMLIYRYLQPLKRKRKRPLKLQSKLAPTIIVALTHSKICTRSVFVTAWSAKHSNHLEHTIAENVEGEIPLNAQTLTSDACCEWITTALGWAIVWG